mgnify:CR=1 FL=1
MVTGEEKPVLIQQNEMTPRMTGRRNDQKIRRELNRFGSFQYLFGIGLSRKFVPVNDALERGEAIAGVVDPVRGY